MMYTELEYRWWGRRMTATSALKNMFFSFIYGMYKIYILCGSFDFWSVWINITKVFETNFTKEYTADPMLTCSIAQLCLTLWPPCTVTLQASLSFAISPNLLKLMSTESVMPSKHLIFCRPLLLLPSIVPSIRVFPNELALYIRWPKYWSFSFSISPSNEYSGLISFKIDLFDRLAAQGTLKSLLQHHSSKAFILWCSGYFMVQLTSIHDYWKNCSLCCQKSCLLFKALSSFVTAIHPRSKSLLSLWLQSLSTLNLETKNMKSDSFHFSPICLHAYYSSQKLKITIEM